MHSIWGPSFIATSACKIQGGKVLMARLPSMTSNPRHIPQSRKRFAHQWNACIDSMSVLICTHDEERLSFSLKCPFSSPSLQFASTRSLAALSTTFTNCARQRICHGGFSKQPVTPDPAKVLRSLPFSCHSIQRYIFRAKHFAAQEAADKTQVAWSDCKGATIFTG